MGMMRPPCCDKAIVKKGLWSSEEDAKLHAYVSTHGTGNWTNVPKKAGLKRCGKSCRLRWTNYLRPNLKHEGFNSQEEELIVTLHALIGSRWAVIANQLPGRTDNDVKNYWNTKLSKKLALRGIDPVTHRPISDIKNSITTLHITASSSSSPAASTAAGRHNSCFSSLNRDLKNILLSHSMPPPQPEPSTLSSASSNDTTPLVQRYPFENRSSAARALPPPPQPPSCEQLEWAEFLAEDAFMYLEEQGACRGKAFVTACAGSGLNDEEEVSSVTGGAAAGVSRSFVEEMLDRDKEMMSELSGILTGHYLL